MKFSLRKVLPLILLAVGVLLIMNVLFPIGFSVFAYLISPPLNIIDPTAIAAYPLPIIKGVLGSSSSSDLTNAANWFSQEAELPEAKNSPVAYFTVSLPGVGLQNITVEVNGSNLKKNAIHYPGTALPGEFGNTVIFGHSALPQFYKKDNPLTIFNPLLKVKIGDEITVHYDGVTYNYIVRKTSQVKPSAVEILLQKYDRRQLTLVTCTPLGTYWYRFAVVAELVN